MEIAPLCQPADSRPPDSNPALEPLPSEGPRPWSHISPPPGTYPREITNQTDSSILRARWGFPCRMFWDKPLSPWRMCRESRTFSVVLSGVSRAAHQSAEF